MKAGLPVLAALVLMACGESAPAPASHPAAKTPAPLPSGQPSQPELITFSGPLSGHLESATPSVCSFAPSAQGEAVLAGEVGGVLVTLTILVPVYSQPGAYGPQPHSEQGIKVAAGGTSYRTTDYSKSDRVNEKDFTILVASDGKSGSVEARLGAWDPAKSAVGVLGETATGNWRCG